MSHQKTIDAIKDDLFRTAYRAQLLCDKTPLSGRVAVVDCEQGMNEAEEFFINLGFTVSGFNDECPAGSRRPRRGMIYMHFLPRRSLPDGV